MEACIWWARYGKSNQNEEYLGNRSSRMGITMSEFKGQVDKNILGHKEVLYLTNSEIEMNRLRNYWTIIKETCLESEITGF